MDTVETILEPEDHSRLSYLYGPFDENLKQIERHLNVQISYHNNHIKVQGESRFCTVAVDILNHLYVETQPIQGQSQAIDPELVHLTLQQSHHGTLEQTIPSADDEITIRTKRGFIRPRNPNQATYLQNIMQHDISFGIGPAGTGKTYLAVGCAVDALERQEVRRIVLTRPAVEAGEKLGFLPGDLSQKIDPYLRPLYDALFEMIGFEKVEKLLTRSVIEVAPLAYMRGRTLNDAFIILDESQNTTIEQMKMFLTRIGFNSKAVVTGDITQIDLPKGQTSGLNHAITVLQNLKDLSFNFFESKDVVRHRVVQRIVEAYDVYEHQQKQHDLP